MATNQALPQSLELRVLNFNVPSDWDTPFLPGHNPHDQVQRFLVDNERWGDKFRYGSAASNLTTDRQLMSLGKADSQRTANDGSLLLYSPADSRDTYCNAGFFNGERVIVVYGLAQLEQTGPRSYQLLDKGGLVAIVRPIFKHPDS